MRLSISLVSMRHRVTFVCLSTRAKREARRAFPAQPDEDSTDSTDFDFFLDDAVSL